MEEATEVKTEETKTEETKTETKVEESKETVLTNEQQAAINLFEALKDPQKSGATLRALADMAGFDLAQKGDRTELKKGIADIIKEELGEDNSILAEKLGPALDKIISKAVDERVKPLNEGLVARQQAELAEEIDSTFKALEVETKGLSKQLEARMTELMEQIEPGKNTKPKDYIRHIYRLAKSDYDEAERIKSQNTQREKNRNTPGVQTGVNSDRVKSGSRLPTIRESVEAAMRGETLE